MCFEIYDLKTLKLTILRFFCPDPNLYILPLIAVKTFLLLKVIINFITINSVIIF